MASTKTQKLPGGYVRETKRYTGGASKSVTYKPTWYGGAGHQVRHAQRREEEVAAARPRRSPEAAAAAAPQDVKENCKRRWRSSHSFAPDSSSMQPAGHTSGRSGRSAGTKSAYQAGAGHSPTARGGRDMNVSQKF